MGLFDFLKKKQVGEQSEEDKILGGAESSEVMIPNHAKEVKESAVDGAFLVKSEKKNLFRVTGLYDLGSQIMLSGFVEEGSVGKKMKATINKKSIVVVDLKVGSGSVDELLAKEEGSVFVKASKFPLIRVDEIIEFAR